MLVNRLALAIVVASAHVTSQQAAQDAASSPRVAAVRFALEAGLKIAATDAVVAFDTTFGWPDGTPVPLSDEQRVAEAKTIAAMLGPQVSVGRAGDFVKCPERRCYAATPKVVVIVDGLASGESDIRVRVFSPGIGPSDPGTLTSAVVDLVQQGVRWTGLRFSRGPTTVVTRRERQ